MEREDVQLVHSDDPHSPPTLSVRANPSVRPILGGGRGSFPAREELMYYASTAGTRKRVSRKGNSCTAYVTDSSTNKLRQHLVSNPRHYGHSTIRYTRVSSPLKTGGVT